MLRAGVRAQRRARRLRLVRVHARPRRRHRGHDRAGARALAPARPAQRDDQGPRDRAPGVGAIEELTARGVNVNVTLLFSVERYEQVIDAYLRGPRAPRRGGRAGRGDRLGGVVLRLAHRRQGRRAARPPTRRCAAGSRSPTRSAPTRATCDRFAGARWEALERAGARPQRPLWASTGTKDPAYSDVLYVERADRARRHQHDAARRRCAPSPTTATSRRTLGADVGRGASAPRGRRRRASTSTRSPPSWSARACSPSATPTRELLRCIEGKRGALNSVS